MRYLTEPWPHQVGAVEYALKNPAVLWHMHMGTGKSKCVLDLIANCGARSVLIVCPVSVLHVWPTQYKRHFAMQSEIPMMILETKQSCSARAVALKMGLSMGPRIVVTNYDAAWRPDLAKAILSVQWDLVVFDESHRIKAHNSACSKFAAKVQAKRKICMTGTPMPHSPLDIFGQMRVLDPGVFGKSWVRFRWEYAVLGGPNNNWIKGVKNLDRMSNLINKVRYEARSDVLKLPDITETDVPVELGAAEAKHYREMESLMITEIKSGVITASNALVKMLRLQQITSGFLPPPVATRDLAESAVLAQPAERVGTSKIDAMEDLLKDLPQDEPLVVFCRFIHDIQEIREVLGRTRRLGIGEVSGRRKDMDAWDAGTINTLVIQMQSGCEGIDLTRARYAVWYSLSFSLGQYDQGNARVHRPGQNRPVTVYRMICENTIDERIAKALDKKAEVIQEVLYGYDKGAEVRRAV